jgi:hypothetical protein
MSLVIGGEQWFEFATNRGYGDFVRWVDGLPRVDFPLLWHLVDWGWVNEIDEFELEVEKAIEKREPEGSVAKTVAGLVAALSKRNDDAESVMISDGLIPDDSEPDEWWIDGKPVEANE